MAVSLPLALLSYLSPPLLGVALYLRFFRRRRPVEGAAFAWGTGWIVVNVLVLTVNQILGVPVSPAWVVPGALALLGASLVVIVPELDWSEIRAGVRRKLAALRGNLPLTLLAVGPVVLLLLILWKGVAYPETGPDSIFYHLFLARDAYESGFLPRTSGLGILESPNAFPNLLVTQQLWIYTVSLASDQILSRALLPLWALLLAGILVHAGNRLRPGGGLLAVLLLASFQIPGSLLPQFLTPEFVPFGRLSVEIWSDVPVTFYAVLSLHFLLRGVREGDSRLLVVAGVFAGGGALTKYNGFLFAAVLLLALLLVGVLLRLGRYPDAIRETRRLPPRAIASFLLPFALVSVPLLLRNALLFGNPVYPFLTEILGGTNPESAAILLQFRSPDLTALKVDQAAVVASSLLFLLFLLSLPTHDPGIRLLQLTGGLYVFLLLLFFSFQSAFFRLVLPGVAAMALAAGVWLRYALFDTRGARWAALAAVAGGLAFALLPAPHLAAVALLFLAVAVYRARPAVHGRLRAMRGQALLAAGMVVLSLSLTFPSIQAASAAKYPTPILGPLPLGVPPVPDEEVLLHEYGNRWLLWVWMNENLPPGARVMTLDPGRYYVAAELVCPASPELVAHYEARSLPEAVDVLRAAGVRYVLDAPFFRTYLVTEPFWSLSPVFQNLDETTYFELIRNESGLLLYRVR